jgi:predicted HNH restriction endonuclease
MLRKVKLITTAELAARTAGGDDYIRTKNNKVKGLALRLDLNPEAPSVIVVGKGPIIVKKARILADSMMGVPTYIKYRKNAWEYIGFYRATKYSEDSEVIAEHKGNRNIADIAGVLFMELCETKSDQEFQEKLFKSQKDNQENRKKRLDKASRMPILKKMEVYAFERNPDVIAEVLFRANGFCENTNCKGVERKAPFNRKSNGTPYLEVHHIVRLADGGEDTVENAIALCPNCHREKHYG